MEKPIFIEKENEKEKESKDIIIKSLSSKKLSKKKIKKKKKLKKKKPANECKNLKELLDRINQEKEEKKIKSIKLKEKKENASNKSISHPLINNKSCENNYNNKEINHINNYPLKKDNDIIIKNSFFSSQIFEYYNGYDKILKEEYKSEINLLNSKNFVEKNLLKNNNFNVFKNIKHINNIHKKEKENKFNIKINTFNAHPLQNQEYYKNIFEQNVSSDFKNMINNINSKMNVSNYSNINHRKKHKKIEKEKNGKNNAYSRRKGDWVCRFCSNINFSFRISCNRCLAQKQV